MTDRIPIRPVEPVAGAAERGYCSQLHTDSAMLGSAQQVDVWLLLEVSGSWPAQALEEGPLAPQIKDWLTQTTGTLASQNIAARAQLIKQSRRFAKGRRLLLSYAGVCYQFDLATDAALTALDIPALITLLRDGRGIDAQLLQEPQFFVCTNGRRDLCCSRFGMPVYRALRELVGERVWQTTHVGGHRFAPNVLTVPNAVLYGRVAVADCSALVAAVNAQRVHFPCLRGRTAYPPAVQAAEGLLVQDGLKLLHVQADQASAVTAVEFAGPETRHALTVRRIPEPQMILAGCDKAELKPYHPFEVVE